MFVTCQINVCVHFLQSRLLTYLMLGVVPYTNWGHEGRIREKGQVKQQIEEQEAYVLVGCITRDDT